MPQAKGQTENLTARIEYRVIKSNSQLIAHYQDMASALQKYFFAPRVPNLAGGFIDDNFALVDLRRKRNGFAIASSAATKLPTGIVVPAFDQANIGQPEELIRIIRQTAEASGLSNRKRWSIALPEGAARTFVIPLESKPAGKRELDEILSWKIERVIAYPATELRASRQRLTPVEGKERYLVTVARENVIAEYEAIFEAIGWQVGLIVPRHLGEAQWLLWDQMPGDKMLVSGNRSGFTVVVMRNGDPVMIRVYECEADTQMDELHRSAVYYRDKVENAAGKFELTGLLVIGGVDPFEAQKVLADALDHTPAVINPTQFGFDLTGEAIPFDQIAGAAGLATLAWQ
jgi:hypothetical protein